MNQLNFQDKEFKKKFTLIDIKEKLHKPEPLFNIISNILNNRLTWFFANFTNLSPNFITIISFIFALISAYLFFNKMFILGAIFFLLRYSFDQVDGRIARLKNMKSKLGALLDNFTGYIGTMAMILALFLTKEQTLILLLIPLLIIGFFLHPLQAIFIRIFIKKLRLRRYKDFLEFEDARVLMLFILPIVYVFLPPIELTPITFYIYLVIIVLIRQIGWCIYYFKDFKHNSRFTVINKSKMDFCNYE